MEECACAIERRLVVCARNECWECSPETDIVPEDCKYEILHPLEVFKGAVGIHHFPRQSGKTIRLVETANHMAKDGDRVYFLTRSRDMADRVEKRCGLDRLVIVIALPGARKHLNGMPPGYVLADEVQPEELKALGSAIDRNVLVAAWYTRT